MCWDYIVKEQEQKQRDQLGGYCNSPGKRWWQLRTGGWKWRWWEVIEFWIYRATITSGNINIIFYHVLERGTDTPFIIYWPHTTQTWEPPVFKVNWWIWCAVWETKRGLNDDAKIVAGEARSKDCHLLKWGRWFWRSGASFWTYYIRDVCEKHQRDGQERLGL